MFAPLATAARSALRHPLVAAAVALVLVRLAELVIDHAEARR